MHMIVLKKLNIYTHINIYPEIRLLQRNSMDNISQRRIRPYKKLEECFRESVKYDFIKCLQRQRAKMKLKIDQSE